MKRTKSTSSTSPSTKRQKRESTVDTVKYGPFHRGQTTVQSTISWLTLNPYQGFRYNPNKGNQFILGIPEEVWVVGILQPYLRLKDLAVLQRTCGWGNNHWKTFFKKKNMAICVPEDVPNLDVAMEVARLFSSRKVYTRENTVKIMLGAGEHEVDGNNFKQLVVTCNNVTFTGRGTSKTTVRGGLTITNRMNVFLEHLNVTNPEGQGFVMEGGETHVEVLECTVKECGGTGIIVGSGATVVATRCEFMENSRGVLAKDRNTKVRLNDCTMHHNTAGGLKAVNHAVVDLYGENTDIHSNNGFGIYAHDHGKVQIHLPSQHNTSHDNRYGNRDAWDNGTITNVK